MECFNGVCDTAFRRSGAIKTQATCSGGNPLPATCDGHNNYSTSYIFSRPLVSKLRQMLCLKEKLNNHAPYTNACINRTSTEHATQNFAAETRNFTNP